MLMDSESPVFPLHTSYKSHLFLLIESRSHFVFGPISNSLEH